MKILDNIFEEGMDSMVVMKSENINYLTGFKPLNTSILILKDEPVLYIPKMDLEDAYQTSKIQVEEFVSFTEIKKFLKGKVGIEDSMTVRTYKRISKDFETKISDLIERSRLVKSKTEIENIKKAIEIAENSIKNVEISGKEYEVAARIEYNMKMNGSKKPAFQTIIASGLRSSLPHAQTSFEILESPVVMDWGAIYNNYCSDTTRTIIETEKQEEIFEIVLQAQKSAIDVIKPGINASYVDKVARDVIKEYGYGDSFIHSTGHGVGLEVHENPSLSTKEKMKLDYGMVITVEPGIYLQGEFGIRIEDVVLIKRRAKVLNKIKKRLG